MYKHTSNTTNTNCKIYIKNIFAIVLHPCILTYLEQYLFNSKTFSFVEINKVEYFCGQCNKRMFNLLISWFIYIQFLAIVDNVFVSFFLLLLLAWVRFDVCFPLFKMPTIVLVCFFSKSWLKSDCKSCRKFKLNEPYRSGGHQCIWYYNVDKSIIVETKPRTTLTGVSYF